MTYDKLKSDVIAYVVNDGPKFLEAFPTIIERAMLRICRALPLEMFNESAFIAIAPQQTRILFKQMNPVIDPITVDYLMVHPYRKIIERRSMAYLAMYGGGRGDPRVFADLPAGADGLASGIMVGPAPIMGRTLEIFYMTRPKLSPEHQTNWYVQHCYDLVLSAALAGAEEFLIEPEQKATFDAEFGQQLTNARRDHQDMIRANPYIPLAISAEPAPKGGSA